MKLELSEETLKSALFALQKLPLEQSYNAFQEINQAIKTAQQPKEEPKEWQD